MFYIYVLSGVFQFSSVCVQLFATPWTIAHQASLYITNSWSSPKRCIKAVMPSSHLILYHPLLLLPSIFPNIRVFSNETALWIRWPKYWGFSFNISPSSEHPALISFRMDWLDLLVPPYLSAILHYPILPVTKWSPISAQWCNLWFSS